MKIFAYKNNKFTEVKEIYFSDDTCDATFVDNDQIYKIEVNNQNKKRKIEDIETLENENTKLKNDIELYKEKLSRAICLSNMIINKTKIRDSQKFKEEIAKTQVENMT